MYRLLVLYEYYTEYLLLLLLAMSYRGLATQSAGSVAGAAEERKVTQSRVYVKELGRQIQLKSGERRSCSYL